MFDESARAVDKEMLGNESEAVLIGGDPDAKNACSCALLAAATTRFPLQPSPMLDAIPEPEPES